MLNSLSGKARKAIALAVVLPVIALVSVVAGVSPASAWHPYVAGSAECSGKVSFTATSWDQGNKGTNTKIAIFYSTDNGESFLSVVDNKTEAEVAASNDPKITHNNVTYEFTATNKNSFKDSFTLTAQPRPTSIILKATALGKWAPGTSDETVEVTSTKSQTINVPAPCAKPEAKIAGPSCTSNEAVVSLLNTGGSPVEFVVYKDDDTTPIHKVTLGANGGEDWKTPVTAATKLTVKAVGMDNLEKSVSPATNCNKPSVKIEQVCVADGSGFTVTYKNEGKVEESFTLESGDQVLGTAKVGAGKSFEQTFKFSDLQIAKGDKISLIVTAGDRVITDEDESVTNDCVEPSAKVEIACAKGGAVFSFSNAGKIAEKFAVTLNGTPVKGSPVDVTAGEEGKEYFLALAEDTSGKFEVSTASSGVIATRDFVYDCVEVQETTTVPQTTTTTVPTEVLGEQIVRPQLAATGSSDTMPLVILGGFLMIVGFGVLQMRRAIAGNR